MLIRLLFLALFLAASPAGAQQPPARTGLPMLTEHGGKPRLMPATVKVTATISGTVMTLPTVHKKLHIMAGATISGPGITGTPHILKVMSSGQVFEIDQPQNIATPTELMLKLPQAAMDHAIGTGCHPDQPSPIPGRPPIEGRSSVSCQCAFLVGGGGDHGHPVEPQMTPAGEQERAALIEECIARTEPADWPDKATHRANAAALHAKALALDPTLPPLGDR